MFDLHTWVNDGAILVDVRTPEEFASGHVEGAVNIPVDELERRVSEIGGTDGSVVVYCRSGARSARAKGMLEKAGFSKVHDMGPYTAWPR